MLKLAVIGDVRSIIIPLVKLHIVRPNIGSSLVSVTILIAM